MAWSKLIAKLGRSFPGRRSLAGSLQLLTGAVLTFIVVALIVGYPLFSNAISYADRMGTSQNYGGTLASLLARPTSLGDYAPVEQSLRDSALPPFVCGVRVLTPAGKVIASVDNGHSTRCGKPKDVHELTFPIRSSDALANGGRAQGTVVLAVEMDDLRISALRSIVAALVGGFSFLLLLLILNRIAVDWALAPLRGAVSAVTSPENLGTAADKQAGPIASAPREIQPLLETLTRLYSDHAKVQGDIRVGQVARQVAHDIRSPLAALEMASSSKNVPETERIIIRQATHRIRDIANDLSGKFRERSAATAVEATAKRPETPQLLPILIDEIVTEMRLHYRQRSNLEITANLDDSNYGLFASVDPARFRRVLCNLIQNGVEAIPEGGSGRVTVRSEALAGRVAITVTDTGLGIPAEIRARLGERGATFGKPKGSGLGLHYAKEMVALWRGSLDFSSDESKGTSVRLDLPIADAPAWFVPCLELETGSLLVVLDDDRSIHQIWNERLSPWIERRALDLLHFSSARELRQWFSENHPLAAHARYLVDFELISENQNETGLALIRALGIGDRSILVTSHYDESDVTGPCQQHRIRLIPKGLAAFVPIQIEERKISAVLIDDDLLTHDVWNLAAVQSGRRILTVIDLGGIAGHEIALDTPIYVDRHLSDDTTGEAVIQRLHERGFTRLYLFTGDMLSPEEQARVPFVLDVVGKTVPPELFEPRLI